MIIDQKAMPNAADEAYQLPVEGRSAGTRIGSLAVSLTSLGFILLQSACVAFMAVSGFRLLLGIGSLAAASASVRFLDSVHGAAVRLPMMALATGGSLLNLYVVSRVRSLRARPASAWRVRPATLQQQRSERLQVVFAVVTLILVVAELASHAYQFGSSFS